MLGFLFGSWFTQIRNSVSLSLLCFGSEKREVLVGRTNGPTVAESSGRLGVSVWALGSRVSALAQIARHSVPFTRSQSFA